MPAERHHAAIFCSQNEFFRWSLAKACQKHGTDALAAALQAYDEDRTGQIDMLEFEKAASTMGFGGSAYDIFKTLDNDQSGTLSYGELLKKCTDSIPKHRQTKQMITALVLTYDQDEGDFESAEVEQGGKKATRKKIDTTKWVIEGRDTAAVQAELRALMVQSGHHVADLLTVYACPALGTCMCTCALAPWHSHPYTLWPVVRRT